MSKCWVELGDCRDCQPQNEKVPNLGKGKTMEKTAPKQGQKSEFNSAFKFGVLCTKNRVCARGLNQEGNLGMAESFPGSFLQTELVLPLSSSGANCGSFPEPPAGRRQRQRGCVRWDLLAGLLITSCALREAFLC